MRHVHAFGDDALGHLDAVGLIDALNSGRVGRAEVVEAAIARTEAVNPALNGVAYEAFDRARAQAAAPARAGFFKDAVLLEQPSVSDNKKTVKTLLDEAGVTVTRFVRFEVGQQ